MIRQAGERAGWRAAAQRRSELTRDPRLYVPAGAGPKRTIHPQICLFHEEQGRFHRGCVMCVSVCGSVRGMHVHSHGWGNQFQFK
eukprot:COSAG01_NODE_701_length_14168_cov_6.656052_6_plen_85_part_00